MSKQRPITFDEVRALALLLPRVQEATVHGFPSLKVDGKLLACVPTHRSAKRGSLAVRIDPAQRTRLLAEAPSVYYVTDHYVNHPMVLVDLTEIESRALQDLLNTAWQFVTSKKRKRR